MEAYDTYMASCCNILSLSVPMMRCFTEFIHSEFMMRRGIHDVSQAVAAVRLVLA